MRIGVYGGTFDPPHIGHLILAADAVEALNLDRLLFVPTSAQPLKVDNPAIASAKDRLEMVRLAVDGDSRYELEASEVEREGLSFTVDTLEELAKKNAGAELFLLIGEDSLATFDRWKKPERIKKLATLAVMQRAGGAAWEKRRQQAGIVSLSTRRIDVSSTEIRERLRAGKSIKGFVPEAVERFIEARGLYR